MPKVKINGVSLYYELTGKGPTVVFVNGLTMDTTGWINQVSRFSEKYQVLTYDCRGQGLSDKPNHVYPTEMHADDLKALLDRVNIKKAHVVGLSNGGMVAQHLAVKYPEKLGALALVDTTSHIDTLLDLILKSWIKATELKDNLFRFDVALPLIFSGDFIERNLGAIETLREMSAQKAAEPIINLAKGCRTHNIKDRLSEIKAPTLIIVGEDDILIPLKHSRALHEGIPNSKLVVMKNCAHVPSIEKPGEFNSIVLDFIKDYDGLLS